MNRYLVMTLRAIPVLAFVAMSTSAGAADPAQLDDSIEALAISLAQTPGQHETLAAFYSEKADEARVAAKRHTRMAMGYSGKGEVMAGHCRNLAKTYETLASQYDLLASDHRALAAGKPATP